VPAVRVPRGRSAMPAPGVRAPSWAVSLPGSRSTRTRASASELVARLLRCSPEDRRQTIGSLAVSVGNREMARLLAGAARPARRLDRVPATTALPSVGDAAKLVLRGLGLTEPQIASFAAGDVVLFNLPVVGSDATIAVLQLKPGLVRGGIFSIKVPNNPNTALKAFMQVRGRVLDVARAVSVPEIEVVGAAVHNQDIVKMLERQGFTKSTEVLPESVGLGANAEVEVYSKRFPVTRSGGTGAKPPSGGGGGGGTGTPPVTEPARVPAGRPGGQGDSGGRGTEGRSGVPDAPAGRTPAVPEGGVKAPETGTGRGVGAGEAGAGVGEVGVGEALGIVVGGLLEGLVVAFVIEGGINVAKHMLSGKGGEDPRYTPAQLALLKAMQPKVIPALTKALESKAKQARKMAIDRPEFRIYADVTMDVDYEWYKIHESVTTTDKEPVDARFVDLRLGVVAATKDTTVRSNREEQHGATKYTELHQITYPIELNPLHENADTHKWRAYLAYAESAVAHKMSARQYAEHTHWVSDAPSDVGRVWTHDDERKERDRKRWGLRSWREEVEIQERIYFADAYIEYMSEHAFGSKEYNDAVSYEQELKRQLADFETDVGCQTCRTGKTDLEVVAVSRGDGRRSEISRLRQWPSRRASSLAGVDRR
jgi:hypothetical protein